MVMVFYGMFVFVENNKLRLLYYLKNRGYRGFSVDRLDKYRNGLFKVEFELGGIFFFMFVIFIYVEVLEVYIEEYVGFSDNGSGNVYFNRILQDWVNYDIQKCIKFDVIVFLGLVIMVN